MILIAKTHTFIKFLAFSSLLLFCGILYAQDNPSMITFKVEQGSSYTFEIASTSTPNFDLISDLSEWGNVRRYEDDNGDNVYDVKYSAPNDYLGEIEFLFSYTGVNPFPFYTYTRKVKIVVEVVSSIIDTKDDVITYRGEYPLIISPLQNDLTDQTLKISDIAGVSYGKVNIISNSQLEFYPNQEFIGSALITYIAEDPSGTREKGNIYIISEDVVLEDQEIDMVVSSENGAYVFLPNADFSLSSHKNKKGKVETISPQAVYYRPIAGKIGGDQLVFTNPQGSLYKVNIDIRDNSPDLDGVNDDFFYTAINQEVTFNVAENDFYDASNITWFSKDLTEKSDGIYSYTPPSGFHGFKRFYYKVNTGTNILTGEVIIKIDDYLPNPMIYEFKVPKNQDLILEYNVPIEGIRFNELGSPQVGSIEVFLEEENVETACGILSSIPKVVYTPRSNFIGFDEFEVEYCTAEGSCQVLKTKVNVYEANQATDCGCISDCVYPGDINADGIVQVNDLLHIGLHFGESGIARDGQGIQWSSYNAKDWYRITNSGINLKHVDADGDGLISDQDVQAVINNLDKYSTYTPSSIEQLRKSPISLVPRSTEVEPGDIFLIDVYVGNDRNPVLDMHGLAFSLNLNPETFDLANTNFIPDRQSWLSEGFGSLDIVQSKVSGRINIGLSRISGLPKSGKGKIGTLQTIVVDEIAGFNIGDPHDDRPIDDDPGLNIIIEIEDVKAVDSEGSFYTLPVMSSQVKLNLDKDLIRPLTQKTLVFPNPTNEHLNIVVNGEQTLEYIRMYDLMGRKIHQVQNLSTNQYQLSTIHIQGGIYFLEVSDGVEIVTKKIKVLD